MNPKSRLIILFTVFVGAILLLAMRFSGSQEQSPKELVRKTDGSIAEQVGVVDMKTARQQLVSADPGIREKAIMSYARAVQHVQQEKPVGQRAPEDEQVAPLVKMFRGEKSDFIRATAITALGTIRAYKEMDVLLEALDDPSLVVRKRAYKAFGKIYNYEPGFASGPPATRRAMLRQLSKNRDGLMAYAEAFYASSRYKPKTK